MTEPNDRRMWWTGVGVAIGAGVGTAIFAGADNPIWIGIGAGLGAAVGTAMSARRSER